MWIWYVLEAFTFYPEIFPSRFLRICTFAFCKIIFSIFNPVRTHLNFAIVKTQRLLDSSQI